MHAAIELDYILDHLHSDWKLGWCIGCGAELALVPWREVGGTCPDCGEPKLYGAAALVELLTGIPAPKDPD
jgi:hypothetical protein